MFTKLGTIIVQRHRQVLVLSIVGLIVAGLLGGSVFSRLSTGGFEDPSTESVAARELLESEFDTGAPNVVFLVSADDSVDSPDVAADGQAFTDELAARGDLANVASYWSLGGAPPLRSIDGDKALVLARIPGAPDTNPDWDETVQALSSTYVGSRGAVDVEMGGVAEIFERIGTTIEGDLARAEAIAIPVTLVLLIGVFGGVVAALLPVAVGIMAILGAFFVLYLVTGVTDVSIFSINLVTALGLGLAIDYSLFIVSRFREELAKGLNVDAAVIRTVETAGRTVAFSAFTVAVSLAALLVFPLYFLRSFAYAGVGVLLVAMIAALVTLPAILTELGEKVNALQVFGRGRSNEPTQGEGFWHRVANFVMARPLPIATVVIVFLLALGLPFLNVQWGNADHRALPDGDPAREVSEVIRTDFQTNESAAFPVVVRGPIDDSTITAHAIVLSELDDVVRVDSAIGRFADGALVAPVDPSIAGMQSANAAWFNVVPGVETISPEAEALIRATRSLPTSFDEVLVGGQTAESLDSKEAIFSRVPLAAALIGGSTFVLLFLMFGSLLVPAKAIVLNLLSLTATFGAMVWVFQQGNGAGLLDFTATGLTDVTTPILMFCIAFGLSMDYEVFLLSRIKEEYDRTGDNDAAVATGLEQTGRIVTAAAVLLAVTFIAFGTSQITFIKLFGLGLATAVLMDATIVRATLVPALMKLAGSANWWAPAPLQAIHERFGISEAGPEAIEPDPTEDELIKLFDEVRDLANRDEGLLTSKAAAN